MAYTRMESGLPSRRVLAVSAALCAICTVNGFQTSISATKKFLLRQNTCPMMKKSVLSPASRVSVRPPSLPLLRMMNSGQGGLSDEDINGLLSRVAQVKEKVEELPILVLDAMLPKQRLPIQTANPAFR